MGRFIFFLLLGFLIPSLLNAELNDLDGDSVPNDQDNCPRIAGTVQGCPDCSAAQGMPGNLEEALDLQSNNQNDNGHTGITARTIFEAGSYQAMTGGICKKIWDSGNENLATSSSAERELVRAAELIIRMNFGLVEGLRLFSLGDRREEAFHYLSTLFSPTRIADPDASAAASRVLQEIESHRWRWEMLDKFYLNITNATPNRYLVPYRAIPMNLKLSFADGVEITTVRCPNSELTGNSCAVPVATNMTIEVEFAPSDDPFLAGWLDYGRACEGPGGLNTYCRIEFGDPVFDGLVYSNEYYRKFMSDPTAEWMPASVPEFLFTFGSPNSGIFRWDNNDFQFPVDQRRIYKLVDTGHSLVHQVAGTETRTPEGIVEYGQYYQHATKQVNGTTYYSGLETYPYITVDPGLDAGEQPEGIGEPEGLGELGDAGMGDDPLEIGIGMGGI